MLKTKLRKCLDWICLAVFAMALSCAVIFSASFVMVYSGGGEWTRLHQWKSIACFAWWLSSIASVPLFILLNHECEEKYPNDRTRSIIWLNLLAFAVPLGLVWLYRNYSLFWLPITLPIVSLAALVGVCSGERRARFACGSLLLCAGIVAATLFTINWKQDADKNANWAKRHWQGRD